ncbi:MAG TPA: hypothetical protein VHY37_01245 [Tepidisphaeraceae bacterium]|jgi:hypothetical protein|nr:hypothetical protein [Tepidisphaeraceae bacterium]
MAKKKESAENEPLEKDSYKPVARWLTRHFSCFESAKNRGLRLGRIDVIGLRDVGGDLSGDIEVVAIEVKRGKTPFANACGQTFGYSVYANRIYLADQRSISFTQEEIFIASHLGIGLIQIKGGKCIEVLSSPYYDPIAKMQLGLLESLGFGRCQLCGSVFQIGYPESGNMFSNLCKENIKRAIDKDRGILFWNREVADRKRRMGIRGKKGETTTYERRFICPNCVETIIAPLAAR